VTGQRIAADGANGVVLISADVTMANAIADALEFTFASGGLVDQERPDYLLDVLQIRTAVAQARGTVAPVVAKAVRLLRVVGGEQS
jgi:hypothetical protein